MLSAKELKVQARALGFAACGVARAEPVGEAWAEQRRRSLREGRHGEMHYLERNLEKRLDPRLLVEGVRSIVSVALNYAPSPDAQSPALSAYAQGRDYHDVMRERLHALLRACGGTGRCFCDTAPVEERYWAQRAGIGFIGRSGQLIVVSSQLTVDSYAAPDANDKEKPPTAPRGQTCGSQMFLGELFLKEDFDAYDAPCERTCGACRACLDACPTGALLGDGTMDARRCLSYLTIEFRGALPAEAGRLLGERIYGCDRCVSVCPHNRHCAPTNVSDFRPSPELLAMTPDDWRRLTPEQFDALFGQSAVRRAGFDGLRRNIDAALQGTGHRS